MIRGAAEGVAAMGMGDRGEWGVDAWLELEMGVRGNCVDMNRVVTDFEDQNRTSQTIPKPFFHYPTNYFVAFGCELCTIQSERSSISLYLHLFQV